MMTSLFASPPLGERPPSLIRPPKLARSEDETGETLSADRQPALATRSRLSHIRIIAGMENIGNGAVPTGTGTESRSASGNIRPGGRSDTPPPSSLISALSLPPRKLDDGVGGRSPARSVSPGIPVRIVPSPSGSPQGAVPIAGLPAVELTPHSQRATSSSSRIAPCDTARLGVPIHPTREEEYNDGIPRSMRSLMTTMASATARPPMPPHLLLSKLNQGKQLPYVGNAEQEGQEEHRDSAGGSEADTIRPGTYARELGEYHHILAALPRSHQSSSTAKPKFISPLGLTGTGNDEQPHSSQSPASPGSPRSVHNDRSSPDTVEQCQGGVDEIGVEWCFFCQRVFSRSKMILEDTPASGTQWMCEPCGSTRGIRREGMRSSGGMDGRGW